MHDSFLVVGPADDPAGVEGAASPAAAFALIAKKKAPFISRGDRSSTHVRELAIWEEAGIDPTDRPWYQESGTDQGASLLTASDKGAYTLVDSATWIVLHDRVELTRYIVDSEMPDVYSVIRVNPEKHAVNEEAALAFADFLTSAAGQAVVEQFGRDEYGKRLFTPGIPSPVVNPTPTPTP
jgi:tungstate transport system substrate-binding protein